MNVLRSVSGFELNEGSLMAKGLYNISDEVGNVSIWFDKETKDELMVLSNDEFIKECNNLIAL